MHFIFILCLVTIKNNCNLIEVKLQGTRCPFEHFIHEVRHLSIDINSNLTLYDGEYTYHFQLSNKQYDDIGSYFFDEYSTIITADNSFVSFGLALEIGNYEKIALGKSFINEDFSMVHQLYKKGLINNKSFSIIMTKEFPENNLLYLGGISDKAKKGKMPIKIKSKENMNGWAFNIDSIEIGSKKKKLNVLGLLGLEHSNIYVNKEIYLFIKTFVFGEALEKGICWENTLYYNKGAEIHCNQMLDSLPIIYLNVNNNRDKIPFQIKKREENLNEICVTYLEELDSKDYIMLNKEFILDYPILFDYNDDSVSFFVNETLIYNKKLFGITMNTVYKIKIILIITGTVMLVLMYILFVVNKKKFKHSKHSKNIKYYILQT